MSEVVITRNEIVECITRNMHAGFLYNEVEILTYTHRRQENSSGYVDRLPGFLDVTGELPFA